MLFSVKGLNPLPAYKYLDVNLDNKLDWSIHTDVQYLQDSLNVPTRINILSYLHCGRLTALYTMSGEVTGIVQL